MPPRRGTMGPDKKAQPSSEVGLRCFAQCLPLLLTHKRPNDGLGRLEDVGPLVEVSCRANPDCIPKEKLFKASSSYAVFRGWKIASHHGHLISSRLIRLICAGSITAWHFGQVVFSEARTLSRLIFFRDATTAVLTLAVCRKAHMHAKAGGRMKQFAYFAGLRMLSILHQQSYGFSTHTSRGTSQAP
jgi:hypothetical protein